MEGTQSHGKPEGPNRKQRKGNGEGVRVAGIRFSKKKEGEGCWFDLLLLVTYLTQARGQAGVSDIHKDVLTGMNSKVQQKTVSDAMEALRKQEIMAEAQNADGERVFSMKRYKFNCSPEIAQGPRGVIEELKADSTGQLIIERFSKDVKEKRAKPEDPADYRMTILLTREFLGSQVWAGNDLLQENYFECPRYHTLHLDRKARFLDKRLGVEPEKGYVMLDRFADHTEIPLMFERTFDGKLIVSHAHCVQNFFANSVRSASPSQHVRGDYDVKNHFGFTDIEAEVPERALTFKRCPIQRGDERGPQSKAAGLKNYEALKPGTELVVEFSAPTKNFVTPKEMMVWLTRVLRLPIRSLSAARGDQVGTNTRLLKLEVRRWANYDQGFQDVQ